jgi:predicted kinase
MDDITKRLRKWSNVVPVPPAADTMQEAAAEIAGLRKAIRRLADQDATLSVQDGSVTVTLDATLTDEEREAILNAARAYELDRDEEDCAAIAATLRKLLERTK